MHSLNRTVCILGAAAVVGLTSSAAMANWNHHRHWHPWFGKVVDKLPTYLMAQPDDSAQDTFSPGDLWVGSGIPATNMIIRTNPFADVELAIKGMLRQGNDILPTYIDAALCINGTTSA